MVAKFLAPLLLLLGFVLLRGVASSYAGNRNILKPDAAGFDKLVRASPRPLFVKFYNPRCPHCVNMHGAWTALAANLKRHARVAAVNCEEGGALCSRWGVRGVPDIKLFLYRGEGKAIVPVDYRGDRTEASLVAFFKREQPSEVVRISSTGVTSLEKFLNTKSHLPHVIMFKEDSEITMGLKTLSTKYSGKLVVGIVNAKKDGSLAGQLGVALPAGADGGKALVIIPAGGKKAKGELYQGDSSFTDIDKYLAKYIEKANHANEKSEL